MIDCHKQRSTIAGSSNFLQDNRLQPHAMVLDNLRQLSASQTPLLIEHALPALPLPIQLRDRQRRVFRRVLRREAGPAADGADQHEQPPLGHRGVVSVDSETTDPAGPIA